MSDFAVVNLGGNSDMLLKVKCTVGESLDWPLGEKTIHPGESWGFFVRNTNEYDAQTYEVKSEFKKDTNLNYINHNRAITYPVDVQVIWSNGHPVGTKEGLFNKGKYPPR